MREQLISFETAKLAKEKGLTAPIMATTWYKPSGKMAKLREIASYEGYKEDFYYAPTQSLLQKWLREEHNLSVEVNYVKDRFDGWGVNIVGTKGVYIVTTVFYNKDSNNALFCGYEQALERGLQKALELI